jgi:hypothetical protein
LPALPDWASPLLGKTLREAFPGDAGCIGNADRQSKHYGGAGGAKVVGWAWDPVRTSPLPRVVLVDSDFRIRGAGEGGLRRADVPQARPDITSETTGWWALTSVSSGPLDAYGVLPDGRSVCKLGHVELQG